jgi:trehalose 6-phosphate synthase/phosphatase
MLETMRLVIVSNRLPYSVQFQEDSLNLHRSPGGLVSGLTSYLSSMKKASGQNGESLWIGWPGQSVPEELQEQLIDRSESEFQSYPVFVAEDSMDKFYHGFCNSTIWPLFHYFPTFASYNPEHWEQYKEVNRIFCDAVVKTTKPGDLIWIHDYHLMLLPKMIRERLPEASIGFFLHIPFPSFEVFRLLPRAWRTEILQGMLGADLVGFHTHHYTQYFLRCCLRILGMEHTFGRITVGNRIAVADTFPMGIEFEQFQSAAKSEEVVKESAALRESFGNRKVIISVDRLDYSKGILNRLEGYEIFLERNPEWHDHVVLVVVVVPSRIGVDHYQYLKQQIDEMVGKVNGKFGTISWTPIVYQYRSLEFEPLVALYRTSDVALITPLRDGMNLISKEYVATRVDQTGVLILSEMAGASSELGEALIINPNNREEISEAIKEALEMPESEQVRKNWMMQRRLQHYDVVHWAGSFFKVLAYAKKRQQEISARMLSPTHRTELTSRFNKASHRLLFLDYDGTLVPYSSTPAEAKPPIEVLNLLQRLAEDPKTDLVLISGRDRKTLDEWFGHIHAELVAEHGAWLRERDQDWRNIVLPNSTTWMKEIRQILEVFVDRLPGSFVEEKEFSLVWHFRKSDLEFGSALAKELVDYLQVFIGQLNIQVMLGNRNLEIRSVGMNKGTAALFWISKNIYDFILALGDDTTDEDLFRALPSNSFSIKVGTSRSAARFSVQSPSEILRLLSELSLDVFAVKMKKDAAEKA